MIKTVSLSEEWAARSRAMYGKAFIDELANFLKGERISTILECGCGDGNVLHGLAERGFEGIGIDSNPEMIALAEANNRHAGIAYRNLSWLEIDGLGFFDAVMCRGNSLPYVYSWGKSREDFDPAAARNGITTSVGKFFDRLRKGGLLYLDTITNAEIERGIVEGNVDLNGIHLKGRIEIDTEKRTRYICGGGTVNGEAFLGDSIGYLLSPEELRGMLLSYNPEKIWSPTFENETNYCITCVRK